MFVAVYVTYVPFDREAECFVFVFHFRSGTSVAVWDFDNFVLFTIDIGHVSQTFLLKLSYFKQNKT